MEDASIPEQMSWYGHIMMDPYFVYLARILLLPLLSMLGLLGLSGCGQETDNKTRQLQIKRGEGIFLGNEHVRARIEGHQQALPAQVTKCINCHKPAQRSKLDTEYAPSLDAAELLQVRVRRGGPAFAYTQDSFCKTISTGIDPEYVVLNRTMPRFDVDQAQCQALWAYLTEKTTNEQP
jgi:hypothetical protein